MDSNVGRAAYEDELTMMISEYGDEKDDNLL